jgi:hypothetical protein
VFKTPTADVTTVLIEYSMDQYHLSREGCPLVAAAAAQNMLSEEFGML